MGWEQVVGTVVAAMAGAGGVAKLVSDAVAARVASKIAVEQETELRTKVKALEAKLDRALELRTRVEEAEWKAVEDFATFVYDCASDIQRVADEYDSNFTREPVPRAELKKRESDADRHRAALAALVVSDHAFREECVEHAVAISWAYHEIAEVCRYADRFFEESGLDHVNSAVQKTWAPAQKKWEPAFRAWRAKHLDPRREVA